MSPPPLITPAPSLSARLDPRQNSDDPYGLNSLYAMYSSLLGDYSYSQFDYASFYASYLSQYNTQGGYDELSSLLDQLTMTGRPRPTGATGLSRPSKPDLGISKTGAASSANTQPANNGGGGGGLSSGAKIGIGVAVPLVVLLLAGVGIFLWCAGKRKGKQSSTTIIAPQTAQAPQAAQFQPLQFQPQPQGYPPNQGYIAGYQQPQFAPLPQFSPSPPPQYTQNQQSIMGVYAKGPPEGIAEMETEYHFARGGAVEIGDTEPKAPEKKGPSWRKMVGGGKKGGD